MVGWEDSWLSGCVDLLLCAWTFPSFSIIFDFLISSFFCGYVVFVFFYLQMLTFHANINVLCCCLFVICIYICLKPRQQTWPKYNSSQNIDAQKDWRNQIRRTKKNHIFKKHSWTAQQVRAKKKVFFFLTFRCNSSFTKKLSTRAESFLTLKPHTKIYFW